MMHQAHLQGSGESQLNWHTNSATHVVASTLGVLAGVLGMEHGYFETRQGKEMIMTASVLIAYATRYGSTQEVAEAVAATLCDHGLAVDLQPMRDVHTLEGYHAVVLGAPLFMFRWHKDALHFLSRHREALMDRPVAVFALGPVHDPYDEQEWQDSRAQLDKELAKFPWLTPIALQMFGGKYDPAKLRFPIKQLAGKAPASDLRDWTAIRAWASDLAAQLRPAVVH